MSDTLEIVEITDSSICIISPELESAAGEAFQNTTKTKRQLSRELSETDQDERSAKKICADIEDKVVAELIVSHLYSTSSTRCAMLCWFFEGK